MGPIELFAVVLNGHTIMPSSVAEDSKTAILRFFNAPENLHLIGEGWYDAKLMGYKIRKVSVTIKDD